MKNIQRTTKEKVLLSLSLAGGCGIFPFAVYRLLSREWAIGIIDLIASIGMFTLFIYVFKTHKIEYATRILSGLTLSAVIFSVNLLGAQQVYWAFPAVLSFFYLLKPRNAIFFTLIAIVMIFPILYQQTTLKTLGTMMAPLFVSISFAYFFAVQMEAQRKLLLEQATKDPLTGAGNRRALTEKLEQLIALFQRTGNKVTMLMIDVDHFKIINDTHGHNAGDRFLTKITQVFKARIRISDSLYRFGGEEFIIVAEDTDINDARILAEEIRTTIDNNDMILETPGTISIGIAELKPEETDEQWIKRADQALFKAKQSGRNQVCISG